jgi:hypothetical protein
MFTGNIADMIREAARAYGANPAGLLRVANAESAMGTNTINDWDINAISGTPSRGLFQFVETTYKSFSALAKKANPAAWMGVNDNWLDNKAQALTTGLHGLSTSEMVDTLKPISLHLSWLAISSLKRLG